MAPRLHNKQMTPAMLVAAIATVRRPTETTSQIRVHSHDIESVSATGQALVVQYWQMLHDVLQFKFSKNAWLHLRHKKLGDIGHHRSESCCNICRLTY